MITACLILSPLAYSKEPANLSLIKQKLEQYHDSGQYQRDIAASVQQAMRYLTVRVARKDFHHKKPAIILDIDETALSNYPAMIKLNFGGTYDEIRTEQDKGLDEAILPTLALYRFAQKNGIAVFFLTGRQEFERKVTEENLHNAGYDKWDGLILRTEKNVKLTAVEYKTSIRKQLAAQGYSIILNMGDQNSDLVGGYADKTFKLANPYYYIS